jgi:hypothetical protein
LHDQCCVRYPDGYFCNEDASSHSRNCIDVMEPEYVWERILNIHDNNSTGCVQHDKYCVEEGVYFDKGDEAFCCNGYRELNCNWWDLYSPLSVDEQNCSFHKDDWQHIIICD